MLVSMYAVGVAAGPQLQGALPGDEGQNQDKGNHCQNRDAAIHPAGSAGSGSHPRDIKKNARFQLLLVEAMFHKIADTHDALQFLVLDHRQVADPCRCHSRKYGIHAVRGATTDNACRHQLLDLQAEHRCTVLSRSDEVPL